MPDLIETIKTRGFFKVIVHPSVFNPALFSKLGDCIQIVRDLKVDLRGWDFPHYDFQEKPKTGQDYVEQSVNWSGFKEIWRYYQSGQFISLKALWEDWRSEEQAGLFSNPIKLEPMKSIDFVNFMYSIAEFLLFTSRLSNAGHLSESFVLSISLNNTKDRQLISLDGRAWLFNMYKCSEDKLEYSNSIKSSNVISNLEGLIVDIIFYFFDRFGWHDFNKEAHLSTIRNYLARKT
jgi:hypothetical protein